MPANITIVRHAPTEYNKKGIFMGSLDIAPDPLDITLVQEAQKQIEHISFDAVFASPYKRAYETAKAVSNNRYDIIVDQRLVERCLGDWEGNPKSEVQALFPTAFPNGIMDVYFCPPNGEPYEHLIKRISNFLSEIYQDGANILVITHNGVFRVMKSLITGDNLSNVFLQFEPYLSPKTFTIDQNTIEKIRSNPFYTVDL